MITLLSLFITQYWVMLERFIGIEFVIGAFVVIAGFALLYKLCRTTA